MPSGKKENATKCLPINVKKDYARTGIRNEYVKFESLKVRRLKSYT